MRQAIGAALIGFLITILMLLMFGHLIHVSDRPSTQSAPTVGYKLAAPSTPRLIPPPSPKPAAGAAARR